MTVHKNEVYYADLDPVIGSEQGGIRPVLVIQNDIGNQASPTVIIAAITSRKKKMQMPTHVPIHLENGRLPKNSMAMLEQIRTVDKERLKNYIGKIDKQSADAIEKASLESLGIDLYKTYRRSMESNMENNIRFLIQREILLSILKNGEINKAEFDKTIEKIRSKHNCKLIVTSAN